MKKRNDSAVIPVAFICDDNYALPTAVAITSMKLSREKATRYDTYVLGTGLSEDSKKRLLSLNEEGFSVTVLDKSIHAEQIPTATIEHVSVSAILKFDLPLAFPDLDKLLYLDSDLLIQKDLTALYNTELGDVYAGVVMDDISFTDWGKDLREWLKFDSQVYFNSGVMLLNLRKMREDSIPEKLLDYRINKPNYFMDQDALNCVFGGNVCLLPPVYNLLCVYMGRHSIEKLEAFYRTDFPGCDEFIYEGAVILHFATLRKPWRHYMGAYLSALYNGVYKYSPYADQPLILEDDPLVRIKASVSYRLGRAITWLPRKIRGGVRCYREHGFAYTVDRAIVHLHLKEDSTPLV